MSWRSCLAWLGDGWSRERAREAAKEEMSLGGGELPQALGGRLGWRKTAGSDGKGD